MLDKTVDIRAVSDISRLQPQAGAALPDDVRGLSEVNHHENWIRVLSVNPDTARRFTAYFGALFDSGRGRLPIRERELIAVVVSANSCGLCEIHHTLALGDALDDEAKARRIALDHHLAPLTEREHALADFAYKVTIDPRAVSRADFDGLRAAGLDEADILEAPRDERVVQSHQPYLHLARRHSRREIFRALKALQPDPVSCST